MLKKLLAFSFFCFTVFSLSAQVGQGALKGKIIDKESKQPLPFVNVVVEMNGNIVTGAASDFDGEFTIKPIPPGKYDVKASFTGYQPVEVKGVVVKAEIITFQNINMTTTAIDIKEFEVISYVVPLIDKDNTSISTTITREDIDKMPGRDATAVAVQVGGVFSKDDGSGDLNIRGGRSDANYYFIDGIKVRGSSKLPKAAIEQVTVITGGLPAQYGDVTGGVISVTTRGASSQYGGSIDYSTSGYKIGDKVYGLDAYGFNLAEFSANGPLLMQKDTAGNPTKPLLGFFISGNYSSQIDKNPSAIGWWKVKDDVRDELIEHPLRQIPGRPGTFLNHEFLRMNDLEKVRTMQNSAERGINLAGKIDVNTGNNTNLTFGGSLDFTKSRNYAAYSSSAVQDRYFYSNMLMNYNNNAQLTDKTWRVYSRFTQRFGSSGSEEQEKSASTVKNAYYSIQMDYNKQNTIYEDDVHRDNLFNYGYVGKFKKYTVPYYEVDPTFNGGEGAFVQRAFRDTLIAFEPSDMNYELSRFTQAYYEMFGWRGMNDYDYQLANPNYPGEGNNFFFKNPTGLGVYPDLLDKDGYFIDYNNLQRFGGLRNGDQPRDVYDMWRTPAYQYNQYTKVDASQFRINTTGSADIKNHAIMVGFEYEQRVDRSFDFGNSFGTGPMDLWTLGRLFTNSHLDQLDLSKPTIEPTGTEFPIISYPRLNASPGEYDGNLPGGQAQRFFDYNLRKKLGIDPDGIDYIDFDSYDPSTYSIDMFSADELNNYFRPLGSLSYYGYDHTGKILKKNPSFNDFFTARDEYGNLTRQIGAFRPVYVAGFIQDKFAFQDLVFNIGLRVDRFDANQKVLKDPYCLFPTVKAGEDLSQYIRGLDANYKLPSNVGADWVVYTDDVTNPSKVVGFRNGNRWYNAQGTELPDAISLRSASGVAPLLFPGQKTTSDAITVESFEDYKPQTNFMPRISFSFPISDEALFFAHYDVLTKRPTDGGSSGAIRLDPTAYYYLQNLTGATISNPNLKPEKTIDYEIGFQQKLNNTSSLKLSAFYRELRNMVQIVSITDAYPITYRTFGNIDFGTVKGLTVSYDLRKTGNLKMRVAYTLQFAEGTGSTSQSALNLIRAEKQNLRTNNPLSYDQRHAIVTSLDYRYGEGKDYDGPVWFGKQVFANTGANFVFNIGSGTPYTRQSNVTGEALLSGGGAAITKGTINGSRYPWQFRGDARIDRQVQLKWKVKGEGEEKVEKSTDMNIYLQILNLFNSKNILNAYRATGNPDDDGYLTSATFQKTIQQQNNEQSFRELYNAKINSPFSYSLPRRIRLGVLINF